MGGRPWFVSGLASAQTPPGCLITREKEGELSPSVQVAAPALAQSIGGGVLLGDEGYRGEELFNWLYEKADILRVMPSDDSSGTRGRPSAVSRARQQGESSFSGLWRRLIGRVYARSWHGLWTSLLLKILHFNLEQAGIVSEPSSSTRD